MIKQCNKSNINKNISMFYKDKSKKCEPYFPTMTITRRKGNGNFKLNTSLQINEINVEKGYTLKITEETSFDIVKEYIIERTSIT